MPVKRASLRITQGYQMRMVAIRTRAQAEARRVWSQVNERDLDATYQVGMLVLSVSIMQREAARLSGAYLHAFVASELGRTVGPPVVDARQVGAARNGDPLRKALDSPMIGVKVAIKNGKTPEEALAMGRVALERRVGLATDTAAREALRLGMQSSPYVVGWQRALHGTCDVCVGAADGSTLPPDAELDIHPYCECVSEPVVTPPSADDILGNRSMGSVIGPEPRGIGSANPFTSADRKAMQHYCGTEESAQINGMLRAGEAPDRIVQAIDRAMNRAGPIGHPIRVYRMTEGTTGEELANAADQAFSDLGFGSTTANGERGDWIERQMTRFTLNIDPRIKAIWGANPSEQELVLQRGCRYVVRSVVHEGNRWQINADVLPPE